MYCYFFQSRMAWPLVIFLFILSVNGTYGQNKTDWGTWCEKSGYTETPRYTETIEYCKKLSGSSSMISYQTFGVSPQGRDLPLLILDKSGLKTPEEIRGKGRVITMVQACIHPGEAEGKDAMLALFRDMAIDKRYDELLDGVSIIFIPIFNVDGHERFTPYNRINQNGPKKGGWRTTSNNLDLNRDFMKTDAPEMLAWLKLYNYWNPDFFIDCHTTDGSDYQYSLTYAIQGFPNTVLSDWIQEKYVPEIEKKMEETGKPIFPYVVFRRWHDPRSGLYGGKAPPRFSHGYLAARNRPGLLIETHMLKDYKTRVLVTYDMVYHTLMFLSKSKDELMEKISKAEEFYTSGKYKEAECVLQYSISDKDSMMVQFQGIDYTVEKSNLTGGDWFRYNGEKNNFTLPFYNKHVPKVTVKFPEAYIIPVEWKTVIDRILLHGIEHYRIPGAATIEFEAYRFSNTKWKASPYEGRLSITDIEMETIRRKKTFEEGSVLIPMNQPNAYLIALMLEPGSEDSFLRWGFFNSIFEQKEYVETYVMEKMAREMIKKDPSLKEQFETWKSGNPEISKNQYAQLMWFYRRTPYFDTEVNFYPVGRITEKQTLKGLMK